MAENKEPDITIIDRKRLKEAISGLHGLHGKFVASIEQSSRLATSAAYAAKADATDADVALVFARATSALSEATIDATAELPGAAGSIKAVAGDLEMFHREIRGTNDAAAEDVTEAERAKQ